MLLFLRIVQKMQRFVNKYSDSILSIRWDYLYQNAPLACFTHPKYVQNISEFLLRGEELRRIDMFI